MQITRRYMSMMTNTGKQDFTTIPMTDICLWRTVCSREIIPLIMQRQGKNMDGHYNICCCRNYRIYGCGNASADSCQSGFYHGK